MPKTPKRPRGRPKKDPGEARDSILQVRLTAAERELLDAAARVKALDTSAWVRSEMLALARAMLRRPRLLMLDEPSLGLAPQVARAVFEALAAISGRGTTILLVEQNARLALRIARHAAILEAGRVVLQGPATELAGNADVREAYLGVGGADASSPKGWRLYRKRRRW